MTPAPFALDDPAVQNGLLLAHLNGIITGFTSALVNVAGIPEAAAYASARVFAGRVWADPAVRDTILQGLKLALTTPNIDLKLPPMDLL